MHSRASSPRSRTATSCSPQASSARSSTSWTVRYHLLEPPQQVGGPAAYLAASRRTVARSGSCSRDRSTPKHYGVHAAPRLLGTQLERFRLIVAQTKVHSHTTMVLPMGPQWYRSRTAPATGSPPKPPPARPPPSAGTPRRRPPDATRRAAPTPCRAPTVPPPSAANAAPPTREQHDVGEPVGDLQGGRVRRPPPAGAESLQQQHARRGDHQAHAEAARSPRRPRRSTPARHGSARSARWRWRPRPAACPAGHQPLPVRLHAAAATGRTSRAPRSPRPPRARTRPCVGREPALGDQHQRHEGLRRDEGSRGDAAQQHDGGQPARGPVGPAGQQPEHGGDEQRPPRRPPGAARATADPAPRTAAAPPPARSRARAGCGAGRRRARPRRRRARTPCAGSRAARARAGPTTRTGIPMKTQRQPRCSVTVPDDERPDDGRHDPARRERRHDRGPQPLRVGPADDDVQGDDHQPAAEPLHGPPQDEHPHGAGGPGEQQPRREGARSRRRAAQRAPPVGPLPGEHHAEEAGGEVRRRRRRRRATTPSSSRAATGMAVPTAVASKAISRTTETMPMLRAR